MGDKRVEHEAVGYGRVGGRTYGSDGINRRLKRKDGESFVGVVGRTRNNEVRTVGKRTYLRMERNGVAHVKPDLTILPFPSFTSPSLLLLVQLLLFTYENLLVVIFIPDKRST